MDTQNLYNDYINNGYIVINYDLEPLKKDFTTTVKVIDRVSTSSHHDSDTFNDNIIYMRSIVGEYDDNHYIVAKKVLSETEFSIVKYL